MTLLLTMLPFYLLGNLHCIGMCGPLVAIIGQHRYRYAYFIGRLISFTLAGMLAGSLGSVLNLLLDSYHIPTISSLLCGTCILLAGIYTLFGWHYPGHQQLARALAPLNQRLSLMMLKDKPWPTFLFGFFTLLLPCGQTLIVFSACAMYGGILSGLINGFAFALITSPSLFAAMHAHKLLARWKQYHHKITGTCAIIIGLLALCRGLADIELIPHLVIQQNLIAKGHLVIF